MGSRTIFVTVIFCCLLNLLQLRAQTKTIDSLKLVLSKMPDDSNKVMVYRQLFIETIDKQNANAAIPIALQQLALAKKIHYEHGQAKAYQLLSVGYETAGNINKSIESALNALKIYEKIGDESGIGSSYNNIGLVYLDENETAEALGYFKKSLDIFSKLNKAENIFRSVINIARVYEQQHNYPLALKTYMQTLAISQKLTANQNIYRAGSLYKIGNIYFDEHQYTTSEEYLLKAIQSLAGAKEAYPASQIYLFLSKIYIIQKQFHKSLDAAKKGLELVEKEDYKTQLAENYLQMANVYAALNNYSDAYRFQQLYLKLKDSLVNTENVKAVAQLQYNYKLEKKESANQVLLKDKKIADTQILLQKLIIQRQYAIGAFIGIGLLSFVVLSVFYYRSLQTKKKDNELLYTQQQEILEQNQEIIAQNEEIFIQKEYLSQLNNTKDKLFSIISHDLRSPVLTLQEALTLFNSDLLTQEEIGSMSDELLKNVNNTSAMLDNVLFWAKNQMEGIQIKKEIFDIREMIIANFINFDKQSRDKKISLINCITEPINVIADAGTIDIVVRNLLSNAIKFCRANDNITISATVESSFLHLSIADTGIGMSKEVQQKLFNAADYHSTYGTANETGTGLGLNLCVEFVSLNGGSIWVESELGKGSIFTFTIPIA